MRKLMWFALGFGLACLLGAYWLPNWVLLCAGVLGLLGGLLLYRLSDANQARIAAVLCFGFFAAAAWYMIYDAWVLSPLRQMDGQTLECTITATDYSFPTQTGVAADGQVCLNGNNVRIRFYLNEGQSLEPGDQVTGGFRLRYTGVGASEEPTYHSADRIFLLGYPVKGHTVIQSPQRSLRYAGAYLRQYLLNMLDRIFPDDSKGFAKALLLGDTNSLTYQQDSDLKISGIRHVAAVSGLHVSILFSMIYFLTGKRSGLTALLGVPALLLFAAMAGFSPSITRACLMQILMLLGILVQKEYDPPTSLAFAALLMLGINPTVVTSVGFQLSLASVAGIFLFSGRISQWLLHPDRLGKGKKHWSYRFLRKAAVSIGVSTGALIMTTPLTAWYFGNVSLISVLTNLLCMWVVTIVFCGIIAACILSVLWLPLGKAAAWLLSWLIRYVLGTAGLLASWPLACVYTESLYIVIWLTVVYGLLLFSLFTKKKRPLQMGSLAAMGLCIALLLSWIPPLTDHYRVTVVDVGQGQCVLLQSGGKTFMVDCGGAYDQGAADKAAAVLLSQGITRLDGLILSHYDRDHVGAAAYLLSRVPADLLILPDNSKDKLWEAGILEVHTGQTLRGLEDTQIQWKDAVLTVFAPEKAATSNETSLCVLFQTEKCDILITGDQSISGENRLIASGQISYLDALIVGHHGADSSTGETLLDLTYPKTAVISVGKDNIYGHPAQEVLDRLEKYGCTIRRTDLEGTIVIRG